MKSNYITGVGLNTEIIPDINIIKNTNINDFCSLNMLSALHVTADNLYKFKAKESVCREDRSLLNIIAKMTIDSTHDAFVCAQEIIKFSDKEKQDFPIYIGNEAAEYNFTAINAFIASKKFDRKLSWKEIGDIKKYLNPLEMLRMLSTNPLYHLSKMFNLRGGGYPISKMSLSGLGALETALIHMPNEKGRALVVAAGNMRIAENLAIFKKMGLIKDHENSNGIIPSFGAASLIVEKLNKDSDRKLVKPIAELISVKTQYKSNNNISIEDWLCLHAEVSSFNRSMNLAIILYDNGVDDLRHNELRAMNKMYPFAKLYSYKKFIGYTGKANNLVDLIISLSDKTIPLESYILINGIGTSVGIGYILVKKLNNL